MVEELRADLGRRLNGATGGPGDSTAAASVEEVGTARLVFAADGASFAGLLLTEAQDAFSVFARLTDPHPPDIDLDAPASSSSSASSQGVPSIGVDGSGASTSYDLSLVDTSSGAHFPLKAVQLSTPKPGQVSLESSSVRFETEEVLVGAAAEAAIRQLLSPDLALPGAVLHTGTMSVNCQAALTPPPTPSSVLDSDDHQGPEDMDQDFLR